jgi:hypothetical protein
METTKTRTPAKDTFVPDPSGVLHAQILLALTGIIVAGTDSRNNTISRQRRDKNILFMSENTSNLFLSGL